MLLSDTGDSSVLGVTILMFTHETDFRRIVFYASRFIKAIEYATAVYPVFNMNQF
jgi:hypothetical protein